MTGSVHVVGAANVDLTIPVKSPPGPGETVVGGSAVRGPGGKGLNQAVAAARLGVATSFIGAVGEDPDGSVLLDALQADGVDIAGVRRVDEPTGLAVILLEPDGANRIVVALGAGRHVDPEGLRCSPDDVVVSQLEIPLDSVRAALTIARQSGAVTVLNAAPARTDLEPVLALVDVLVVNEPELTSMTGCGPPDRGGPARGGADGGDQRKSELLEAARRIPVGRATVVTRGALGALLVTPTEAQTMPAPSVKVVDTTGAGDCFVGALAARLVRGDALAPATETAVKAAALSVTRPGSAPSMPNLSELRV